MLIPLYGKFKDFKLLALITFAWYIFHGGKVEFT